jgi:hypothetical protein
MYFFSREFLLTLYFGGSCKDLAVPDSSVMLQASLTNLKFLEINDLCYAEVEEVSCALCLIRSSPNLQKLLITAGHIDLSYFMLMLTKHLSVWFTFGRL